MNRLIHNNEIELKTSHYTLLFVDDDLVLLERMERLFRHWSEGKLKILTSHTVGKAIALLQQEAVDIIVTDLRMPVMDGLQFLKLLHRKHPNMHKVVMTGLGDETERARCLEAGASLFLEKPQNADEMESTFASLMELAQTDAETGFSGSIQGANLGEMVQMLCLGGSSMILEIKATQGEGKIYISRGAILHAETDYGVGYDGFYYLMALRGGKFSFQPFVEPAERTISGSWEKLLLESARQVDETNSQKNLKEHGHKILRKEHPQAFNFETALDEAIVFASDSTLWQELGSRDPESRLDMLDFVALKGRQMAEVLQQGDLQTLYLEAHNWAALVLVNEKLKAFTLSEQVKLSSSELEERLRAWISAGQKVSV